MLPFLLVVASYGIAAAVRKSTKIMDVISVLLAVASLSWAVAGATGH